MVAVGITGSLALDIAVDILGDKLSEVLAVLVLRIEIFLVQNKSLKNINKVTTYNVIHGVLADHVMHLLIAVDLQGY